MIEHWIDVSAHNGHIDWAQVKASGIQGVVIRGGYGNDVSQKDTQFGNNIKGELAAGLKVAIYWFSYADSVDDALKEWAACRSIIAPYKGQIKFVAFDYEYDSMRYYEKLHGAAPANELVNDMTNAFLGAAKADGWGTALYTNNDYRRNVFSAATLAAWDIWLADYNSEPEIVCAMQQTGSTGSVPGISGNVDMDTAFKQYGDAAPVPAPTPAPVSTPANAHHVGEDITFSVCYSSSTDTADKAIPASKMLRDHGTITEVLSGAHNPYLLDNGLCWVNDDSISGGNSAPVPAACAQTYIVKPGDTLSGIAVEFNTTVRELADLNGIQNPNEIQAGSTLRLTGSAPTQPAETIYIVKPGDTLSQIAVDYNTTVSRLAEANGISNPNNIQAGWNLKIV